MISIPFHAWVWMARKLHGLNGDIHACHGIRPNCGLPICLQMGKFQLHYIFWESNTIAYILCKLVSFLILRYDGFPIRMYILQIVKEWLEAGKDFFLSNPRQFFIHMALLPWSSPPQTSSMIKENCILRSWWKIISHYYSFSQAIFQEAPICIEVKESILNLGRW
jgi:hypothetical protein